MMKKYLLMFTMAGMLGGCSNSDDPQPKENFDMTVLAYLVGENSLDDDLKENIRTMFTSLAALDKSATLLVYWDGDSNIKDYDTPVILRYTTDGTGRVNGVVANKKEWMLSDVLDLAEIVKEYQSQLSTDKEVMAQVLSDLVTLSPTGRIGLVAGAHATSWTESPSSRAFGEENGNWINISDMADAIKSTNRIFDFLLFDACLMGSIEVCYDFREVTNYQIVSVLEIPAYGFPYNLMLEYLYEGNKDSYIKACKTYIDFYNNKSGSWGTISLVDSREIDALTALINTEIILHKDKLYNFNAYQIQEYGRRGFKYCSFDLEQFVKVLNDDNSPSNFDVQLDKTVVYTGCVDKPINIFEINKDNYSGIGLYIPMKDKNAWNSYFKTLDWYTAAGWNEVTFSWGF